MTPDPAQQVGVGEQLAAVDGELAVNRGKLLTHAHLLRRVWGHGYETETEYLRVYVRRLRAKLEAEGSTPLILTQPRAGYRLAPE